MLIDGVDGLVEIVRRDLDGEAFDVRAVAGDFAGRNGRIHIAADSQRQFLHDLRVLERDRRGVARLTAMSPDEFEIAVQIVDSAGHAAVVGMIGRLAFAAAGHRYHRLVVNFEFGLDPTSLPRLVAEAMELVNAG
jgi:hypothetical protein